MRLSRLKPELAVLVVAAFATRLWRLFVPDAVVFDETYFRVFAGHYFDGAYFFDTHPPLGKLLLAAYARLIGLSSADLLGGTAVGMRVLPAVCGALLVPLVWGLLRRLEVSRPFAFLGAFLVLADNALLVESRFILMDSMLMLFGLGAVYLYLVARSAEGTMRWLWVSLAALAGGAAASVKWTGLTALALVAAMWVWDARLRTGREWRRRLGEAAILLLVPAVLYAATFAVHFRLLPKTGDGDAFMTPAFRSTLLGSPSYDPQTRVSFASAFSEVNAEMLHSSQRMTATHPYASRWYTWPLEVRPIYFWMGETLPDGAQGHIYLIGNPAIWWGVIPAILVGLGVLLGAHRKLGDASRFALVLTAAAYVMNFVPFAPISRPLFLYHYFFSFVYSVMFAMILWDAIVREGLPKAPSGRTVAVGIASVALVVLIGWTFFLPVTYGMPVAPQALATRMWLPSWR